MWVIERSSERLPPHPPVSVRRSRDGSGGRRRRTAALTGNPPAAAPDLARQPDDSTASPNTYIPHTPIPVQPNLYLSPCAVLRTTWKQNGAYTVPGQNRVLCHKRKSPPSYWNSGDYLVAGVGFEPTTFRYEFGQTARLVISSRSAPQLLRRCGPQRRVAKRYGVCGQAASISRVRRRPGARLDWHVVEEHLCEFDQTKSVTLFCMTNPPFLYGWREELVKFVI